MIKKRNTIWLILIIIFILVQVRGYYIRNLKVDDEFLEVIADKIVMLEEKRNSNRIHTLNDEYRVDKELNTGHMASKSNIEISISAKVQSLSSYLRKYYDALFIPDTQKAAETLEKYFKKLSELEELLSDFKGKRPEVDILWEKGIFK